MSEITINYHSLENASGHAKKVSEYGIDYLDELNNKVTNKMTSLPQTVCGCGNQRIDNANYYIEQKKIKLRAKSQKYNSFAKKLDNLESKAKTADLNVAKSVNGSKDKFLNEHKNLSGDGWCAFFANLAVDFPALGWLVDKATGVVDTIKDLKTSLKKWYEIDGGKKIIDTALAIGEVVLAVVGAVVAVVGLFTFAGVWAGIVAVAGAIAAVIALSNAIVNLSEQIHANQQDDPAWSQYYGEIDSASDAFRKTTFKSGVMNKLSGPLANAIDVVDFVCSVICIGDALKKLGSTTYKRSGLKKMFSSKTTNKRGADVVKFDFSKFKSIVTSKDGRANIAKTLKSNWKGIVFGDSGGVNGFLKRQQRGFTGNVDVNMHKKVFTKNVFVQKLHISESQMKTILTIEKRSKIVSKDLTIINNGMKLANTTTNTIMNGLQLENVYNSGMNIYKDAGNAGATSGVSDLVQKGKKVYGKGKEINTLFHKSAS